jgi:hypothetical protein
MPTPNDWRCSNPRRSGHGVMPNSLASSRSIRENGDREYIGQREGWLRRFCRAVGGCRGCGPCASGTCPTKRKPLRGNVLMRRCSSPESPIAPRATFRRVVTAASETLRPFQMALIKVVLADDALPVADQVVEQVEYLWRDGDQVRTATQLTPVGVECVPLEEIAQAAISLGGLRSSRLKHRLQRKE